MVKITIKLYTKKKREREREMDLQAERMDFARNGLVPFRFHVYYWAKLVGMLVAIAVCIQAQSRMDLFLKLSVMGMLW